LRKHCAGCHLPLTLLPPALRLAIRQLTLFAENPSKSTLAHDVVAAAVLHKHHLIIRVGAGLIQFVYGSHSHWATGVTSSKILYTAIFLCEFSLELAIHPPLFTSPRHALLIVLLETVV